MTTEYAQYKYVCTNQPDTKSNPNPNRGSVTITVDVDTYGATTQSRTNFSEYVRRE